MSIFMIKEYMPQYFETNPPITSVSQHDEILRAGYVKWFYMSDSEKAPWIELNEEMNAEGCFLERVMHVPPQFWERICDQTCQDVVQVYLQASCASIGMKKQ